MSRKNKDRKELNGLRKVILLGPNHPEYSLETMRRMRDVNGKVGVNRVAVFHEQFCANALRRGAKKCLCTPEIKVLDPENLAGERDQRAWHNHYMGEA